MQIGRWTFDRSLNTLSCGNDVVHVEPRAADLLHVLAQHAGTVVGRAELLESVWPGVVVGDEALSQSITKLRRALGDTSRDASYIQTVPKRGYRLIADLTAAEPAGSRGPVPDPPGRIRPVRRSHAMIAVALAVAGAAVALVLVHERSGPGDDLAALVAARAPDEPVPLQLELLMRRFDAIGGDAATERIARAFWKQVAAGVSQAQQLRVILDDREVPAPHPPEATNRYQVDGTVQRLGGERFAIHLILSRPTSGVVVWSRRVELALQDLSRGDDRSAADLLEALTLRLSESERERLARPYTRSLIAFEHFLDGQAAFGARERANNAEAREHYERAVAADPTFARAFGGLALTHAADATFGWSADRAGTIAEAVGYARRAEALDTSLPEVHWTLAWVEAQRRDHAQALRHVRRAIELNPSYADAYALAASIATYIGRPSEALALMRVALRLRPVPNFLHYLILGRAHFLLADDVQAIANLRASLERNPAHLESRVYMAAALQRSGASADAAWEADEIRAMQPGFVLGRWLEAGLMTDRRARADLALALTPLGLDGERSADAGR
jgi:DNA-binding winged helix-turn-helix (wHTH) protein/tetratricopeptide (TPR) repeat protein